MAAVAATHGEAGSKYLLPLSVDGLVVVSSISLVELTVQITAAATPPTPTTPTPTAPGRPPAAADTPTSGGGPTRPRRDGTTRRRPGQRVPDATAVIAQAATEPDSSDAPPADPARAVTWWRAKDPAMSARRIAATVGLSDRTVRRILNPAPNSSIDEQSDQLAGAT